MAKGKEFKFYENFMKAIDTLPENQRAEACYKFCRFGIYGELPDDVALKMFCMGVSVSVQKYQNCGGNHNPTGKNQYTKNAQVGQVGQVEQTETKTKTKTKTKTETKTKTKTETETKTKIFIRPTLQEVEQYCTERNNNINAQYFMSYYDAKGWMIGKNKVKDWKACIRTWELRNKKDADKNKLLTLLNESED